MTPDAPQAIDAPTPSVSPAAASPADEVFVVRAYRASDLPYVRDSWLRSSWDIENRRLRAERVPQKRRTLAGHAWYALNRKAVTALIEAPDVTILVAVDRLDEDHIAGWIATRAGAPLWGAVKQAYRRNDSGMSWGVHEMLARAAGLEG